MKRIAVLLLAALLPVACSGMVTPMPDTARIDPSIFGIYVDPGVGSINFAAWAFASPANTAGRPAEAARAVAAVDYLGGALTSSPRWSGMSPTIKDRMLAARQEVRGAVGVAPNAPSQAVVDSMSAAFRALAANDQAAALHALGGPIYTIPPQEVLARLTNLPPLPIAAWATSQAMSQEFGFPDSNCILCS
jgi:hypothetical protein